MGAPLLPVLLVALSISAQSSGKPSVEVNGEPPTTPPTVPDESSASTEVSDDLSTLCTLVACGLPDHDDPDRAKRVLEEPVSDDQLPYRDQLVDSGLLHEERKRAFNSWGGKRTPAFNSWAGKRAPSFNSLGGKGAFNSWGGKRVPSFNSWGGKRVPAFNSWGGKRVPSFNSWGGKRASSFNNWGGKRVSSSNRWDGKRAPAFNSWGGKRAPAFNSQSGKRAFNSWDGKGADDDLENTLLGPQINSTRMMGDATHGNWDEERTGAFNIWSGEKSGQEATTVRKKREASFDRDSAFDHFLVRLFGRSWVSSTGGQGKRNQGFNSWGGKRSTCDYDISIEETKSDQNESDEIVSEDVLSEERSSKQSDDKTNEVSKRAHPAHSRSLYRDFKRLGSQRVLFNPWGGKRSDAGISTEERPFLRTRSKRARDYGPLRQSRKNRRGPDFYAWGGKRSVASVRR